MTTDKQTETELEPAEIYTGIYIPSRDGEPDIKNSGQVVQLRIGQEIITYAQLREDMMPLIASRCVGRILEAKLKTYSLENGETILDPQTNQEVGVDALPRGSLAVLEKLLSSAGIKKIRK